MCRKIRLHAGGACSSSAALPVPSRPSGLARFAQRPITGGALPRTQLEQRIDGRGAALLPPALLDRLAHQASQHSVLVLAREGLVERALDVLGHAEIDGGHGACASIVETNNIYTLNV
ncbi:MAG: hypothetical protein ACT4P4_22925, partial [Betaproteobacteria bacterium]